MVSKFNLIRTPRILFGERQAENLPRVITGTGKHILIVTGRQSHLLNPVIPQVLSVLEKEHKLSFESVGHEPTPTDIDNITARYNRNETDVVLAIGGGSVLDAGKAVSAMLMVDEPVREYLEVEGTRKHPGQKKYFIAVPSTSGTGSEATNNAVLSETGKSGFKRSLRHENFVPDVAVVDPLLVLNCPANITASSGMDAFTQLIESFLSVKSNPVTDALALEGIINVKNYLFRAYNNGDDIEARSGMAYAAMLSGITLSNAGLGLVHGFASTIGGMFYAPHGVICGTLMAVVNRFNIESLVKQPEITTAHTKYGQLGKILSGSEDKDLQWYMKYVADYMAELTEKLNIKKLGAFGVTSEDLDHIANISDHKANPVKFEKEELVEMLKRRL